jgi:hypothetical protein
VRKKGVKREREDVPMNRENERIKLIFFEAYLRWLHSTFQSLFVFVFSLRLAVCRLKNMINFFPETTPLEHIYIPSE